MIRNVSLLSLLVNLCCLDVIPSDVKDTDDEVVKLLEGIRGEVKGAPGTLVARALVDNTGDDGALRAVGVDDADAAVADGVSPGLNAHLMGVQCHDGFLVSVPFVVTGAVAVGELFFG